jgi:hypothetical protein
VVPIGSTTALPIESPTIKSPNNEIGFKASKANTAVVVPVPPLAIGNTPVTPIALVRLTLEIELLNPDIALLVNVSVVALPTKVSVASGNVTTLFAV